MATSPLTLTLPTSPLTDPVSGEVRPEWRRFFTGLAARTGGTVGLSMEQLQTELNAEETARASGDQTLGIELATEASTRQTADEALQRGLQTETNQRSAADTQLRFLIDQSATSADLSSYVQKSQLCSLWSQCNLLFLPTTDPGSGMPWLNGSVLSIGTSALAVATLELEDGSGHWALEDGSGSWVFG